MLACVDVDYRDQAAKAACLLFGEWSDDAPILQVVAVTTIAAPYRPGEFYLRELPAVLTVLRKIEQPVTTIVIDGYVWLGDQPGFGARLYEAMNGAVPIVGVAKTAWRASSIVGARRAMAVTRGTSARPLFVTSAGMDVDAAAASIARMHGAHRMPTLLKLVDRLARDTGNAYL